MSFRETAYNLIKEKVAELRAESVRIAIFRSVEATETARTLRAIADSMIDQAFEDLTPWDQNEN